ncbi:MAG: PAS domain S-box protein [Flavobacterium sp.]|nr:PAS domain S-box protein [Flavobacterium sp.]
MNINNLDLKLRISINQIGLFFELIPVSISITTPDDGVFIYVNKNFETLYKIKRKKILQNNSLDLNLISFEDRKLINDEIKINGEIVDRNIEIRIFNGELRNMIISIQKIIIEKKEYYITTSTDVTNQLKYDLEITSLNKELAFENSEKQNRADELHIANEELDYQKTEKTNRADELKIANKELAFQNQEKQNRADELYIANQELVYQNIEKLNRADELEIANKELAFQNQEKQNRADELQIANIELAHQNNLKECRTRELTIKNNQLIEAQRLGQIGSWDWDLESNIVVWSDELHRIYGQKPQEFEITGDNFTMQMHPEDVNYVSTTVQKSLETKKPYQFYYRIIRTDNSIRFLNGEGKIVCNKEGKIIKLTGIAQDITDKKLATQYAYSRSLIEASLDPLVTINVDGIITDMNQAMVDVTDKSRELLLNTAFSDYFTDSKKANEIYKKVFENGFVNNYPLTIKDGKLTYVLFNGSVFKDEKGKVIGAVVVARDITQLKKNEDKLQNTLRELSAYKYALDESSIVDLTDSKGIIKYVNKNFCDISKYKSKELIGHNHRIVNIGFHTDEFMKDLWETISKGNIWKGEMKNKAKDGSFYWSVTTIVPFLDEHKKPFQYMAISTNVSEQKKIEIALREAKIIAEKAQETAQNAVDSKQQFLSNMSHEIRTPMNAIIGFTKVILKTDLTIKQKEYLNAIKTSGDSMIVLINDILDLAKVNSGKMVFDENPFKLSLSIQAMLHLFETKVQEKNIELKIDYDNSIPDILVGDAVKLNQIILNLVGNAVKFTFAGKIVVEVKMIEENQEKVKIQFSVTDTGIGIEADKLDSVFENFQQAHSISSRLYGGTGLGLAIVKQLVETQNGTINVISEIEVGSTFTFVLDFKKTDVATVLEAEIQELDSDIKDIKVLVVEDMQLNQLLMKTLLDDFGFESEFAANGQIAVDKLAENHYDVVLMDIQMPVMNGYAATDFIRNKLKLSIPIIALTADVTSLDIEKCKSIGMDDYLAKPVDERLLYSKLVGILKKPSIVIEHVTKNGIETEKIKSIDLNYLMQITKSNPKLMSDIISVYLEQTPQILQTIKKSRQEKDWSTLYAAIHKIIPSFSIMGIDTNIHKVALKIQEIAKNLEMSDELDDLINQLDIVCNQACEELIVELKVLNK